MNNSYLPVSFANSSISRFKFLRAVTCELIIFFPSSRFNLSLRKFSLRFSSGDNLSKSLNCVFNFAVKPKVENNFSFLFFSIRAKPVRLPFHKNSKNSWKSSLSRPMISPISYEYFLLIFREYKLLFFPLISIRRSL